MGNRRSGGRRWLATAACIAALPIACGTTAASATGTPSVVIDTDFTQALGGGIGFSPYLSVAAVALQPDGKIIVGGNFSSFGGQTAGPILRLEPDGTLDTAFTAAVGGGPWLGYVLNNNAFIDTIALQSDGSIIVGGRFDRWNGTPTHSVARLHPDGSLDTTFAANLGAGFESRTAVVSWTSLVSAIAPQSDDGIVVGGDFDTTDGHSTPGLARLDSSGHFDPSFTAFQPTPSAVVWSLRYSVEALVLQPDGRLLVETNVVPGSPTTDRPLVRVMADGTLDTSFVADPGTPFDPVYGAIALQPDGKVLIGGWPDSSGVARSHLARLMPDGSPDRAFTTSIGTGPSGHVSSIAVQPDGRILAAGSFWRFDGQRAESVVRLEADGHPDGSFPVDVVSPYSGGAMIGAIQPDQRIILYGSFKYVGSTASPGLARIERAGIVWDGELPSVGSSPASLIWLAMTLFAAGCALNTARRIRPSPL